MKDKEDELNLSQMSLNLSSESDGAGDSCPEDNQIDKAFKKLQKKKDKFQRFKMRLQSRRIERAKRDPTSVPP